jgi:hypothetical protein
MNKTNDYGLPMPTANLAINKSRLKVYNKKSEVPTYYLQKGQEFQIELFNPTTGNILAKISLNGKPIAQGGLVLRPGERAFLDRYIDVARKFKFDTYEVANTKSVQRAIEENGDFKVEFYSEYIPPVIPDPHPMWDTNVYFDGSLNLGGVGQQYNANITTTGSVNLANLKTTNTNLEVNGETTLGITSLSDAQPIATASAGANTMDFAPEERTRSFAPRRKHLRIPEENVSHHPVKKSKRRISRDTIETGRVEMGSTSNQKMTTVNMNWLTIPFHTVEYKMLPVSQKINTTQSINVKRYCTNCGAKQKPSFKFCPDCGTKC